MTTAEAAWHTIPVTLPLQIIVFVTQKRPARIRVYRGAVEPATGSSGLKENPCPVAMFLANVAWIQESSSEKPQVPAITFSRDRNRSALPIDAATMRI